MNDYIENVTRAVKIDEGRVMVEKFLITVYMESPISSKDLSRKLFLPVPLVTAIKREFMKLGLLVQDAGIQITEKGILYIENQCHFKGVNKELYLQIEQGNFCTDELIGNEGDFISQIYDNRPSVNRALDQAHCTVKTSFERALLLIKHHTLINKKILCIGDDDLVSISIGFILKVLYSNVDYNSTEIHVIDVDERLLAFINEVATVYNLPIICHQADIRQSFPSELENRFDCFFTDPPYTLNGLDLFISRGLSGLKRLSGLPIFLSFAHKSQDYTHEMLYIISKLGLSIHQVIPKFNKYLGASLIGNIGQMYIMQTTSRTSSKIKSKHVFNAPLYTRAFHKKTLNRDSRNLRKA